MFGTILFIALYIFGLLWCCQVVRRFRDDVREIREMRDSARTGAIVFIWLLTVIIAIPLTWYGIAAVREIAGVLGL